MKRKLKILNMADISICPNVFECLDDIAETAAFSPSVEILKENIADFDIYFASLKIAVGREILDKAANLKVIATPSTGTDHIGVKYATQKGIKIISLKDDIKFLENITSTAELVWGLLLSCTRKIPWAFTAAKNGIWGRDMFRGNQLSGKTFGIIGYGRLGRIVGQYAKAFRMNVVACDIKESTPDFHVKMLPFDDVLKNSDVISIHVHLTPENKGLINKSSFDKMKKGVVLINTSRGAIIDEGAFLDALETGKVPAAGIDVIDGEWNDDLKEHPLIRYACAHDNLVITPHVGGVTYEAQIMTVEHMVKKLKAYLEHIIDRGHL